MWWNALLLRYKTGRTYGFFGEDKSMNMYGRSDPMERRMGFKWRVASLLDNGQGFSFPALGTQPRVNMHAHACTRGCVHTCTCSRTYISSVTHYLVLTHYLTLDRLVALSLGSPLVSTAFETHSYSAQNEPWRVLIRPRYERGLSRAFVRDEFSAT